MPGGFSFLGGSPSWGVHLPGGVLLPGGSPWGGLLWGVLLPGGFSFWGVFPSWGASPSQGVLLLGGSPSGGVLLPGGFSLPVTSPPVNRITHSCKNITLATTLLRPVTIGFWIHVGIFLKQGKTWRSSCTYSHVSILEILTMLCNKTFNIIIFQYNSRQLY